LAAYAVGQRPAAVLVVHLGDEPRTAAAHASLGLLGAAGALCQPDCASALPPLPELIAAMIGG
jgi:hypothetical protein